MSDLLDPLFLCAIHTGLRSAELAGLQWGDIDFNGKYLIVRRSVVRGRIEKTKTSKTRRVDMSDALIQALEVLKRTRKAEYLAAGRNEIPEWVFLGPGRIIWEDGKPVGREEGQRVEMYNVKNRYFLKCLEKAKLRRIRFHDLRHTFASLLIQNGESPAYVKEQLGHASIKMTVDVTAIWCLVLIEKRSTDFPRYLAGTVQLGLQYRTAKLVLC